MITKNLLAALENIGFSYFEGNSGTGSHAFAVYGGFLISAYEAGGKKTAYFNFKFSDGEENASKRYSFSEAFSERMSEFSVSDYSLGEDGLKVICSGSIPDYLKLLDFCVELLIASGIEGAVRCSQCGNKFGSRNPKKVTYGNDDHLMCEHCAIEAVEENRKADVSVAEPAKKKKVLPGVFGSLLFSLIGVFLYFAAYYWLSPAIGDTQFEIRYLFSALGFVVSLLAYCGYRLFCRRASLTAYIIIPIFSLLFTAIGQYIGIVFEFIAKGGFSLSCLSNSSFWLVHLRNNVPSDVSANFESYSGYFYIFLTVSLLFAAVGSAIFLLSLREKTMPKKENLVVETLKIN